MGESNLIAWIGNTLSPAAILGWAIGIFPGVVLFAAFLFYLIQLFESDTFQTWIRSRRLRKMAKLKIKMAALEALELINHPTTRLDFLSVRKVAQLILAEAREQAKIVVEDAKKNGTLSSDEKHT